MEEGYDEELEKLLGEIPIATSTPLAELQIRHPGYQQDRQPAKDGPIDQAVIRTTVNHQPVKYTTFSEASVMSLPITTRVYDVDMSNEQARCPTDPGIGSDCSLPRGPSGHMPCYGNANLSTLQNYLEQATSDKGNGSSSSISGCPQMDAVACDRDMSSGSCLPPSLQLLDSLAHDYAMSEFLENELHDELDKLTLIQNGLSSKNGSVRGLPVQCFLSQGLNPLDLQGAGVRLLPERDIGSAALMQLGSVHPTANRGFMFPPVGSYLHPYSSDKKMIYAQRMQEAAAAAAARRQHLEERVYCGQRIKEEFQLRQAGTLYFRRHPHDQRAPTYMFNIPEQQSVPKKSLTGGSMPERHGSTWVTRAMVSVEAQEALGVCQYFLQGFCTRGDLCPFSHSYLQSSSNSASTELFLSETNSTLKGRNGLISTPALPSLRRKNFLANGHLHGPLLPDGAHLLPPFELRSMSGGATWNRLDNEIFQSVNMQHIAPPPPPPSPPPPPPPKYMTLQDVEGHIYGIAKDQHGCRFLQRKFEEGVFEDVQKIFIEIIDHVVELMTDPFGNYLVQKLLEVCNESQRMEILYKVTGEDQLVTICLNMHGTRAVQKLIETLNSAEQVSLVVSSLKQGVVTLIKDLNGNHVVQRCLQRLSTDDSQFIFDAAAYHCIEIATHRHGCCVLQRCVDFSSGHQRNLLVAEIAANALVLSQDPFGNYVVQYILDLGLMWAVGEVIARLDGNYMHLSMQKFSSNVVEKCLKLASEENKAQIISELMNSAQLAQLLQDPFANYVIQSALTVSKGALHSGLVEAIRLHLPALRSSPYGKRILSRTSLKK